MKVQAVILLLFLPWVVHGEQQYYGTRLSNVSITGTDSSSDLDLVPLHAGDILTPQNVRSSIQFLYNTGHYSYVEVDAEPTGEGLTALTFRVRPNFFFSTIRLEPEDLLERPLSGYFRLPYGEKFSTSVVEKIVQETL